MRNVTLSLLVVLALAAQGQALSVPVDLGTWTVEQYQFNLQPNANWVLSAGDTVADQTVNADASILLSDFDIERVPKNWALV